MAAVEAWLFTYHRDAVRRLELLADCGYRVDLGRL